MFLSKAETRWSSTKTRPWICWFYWKRASEL